MNGDGAQSAYDAHSMRDAIRAQEEVFLRQFFDVMVENGMCEANYWPLWSAQARDNSELWPICAPNTRQFIGGIFFKGQTVHIVIKPEWHSRWVTRSILRGYREWAHPGELRALMRPDNTRAIAFAERLGFRFSADQGLYHLYIKEPVHAEPE